MVYQKYILPTAVSEMFFKRRFEDALTFKGTQQCYALIPKITSKLLVKHFPDDVQFGRGKRIIMSPENLS